MGLCAGVGSRSQSPPGQGVLCGKNPRLPCSATPGRTAGWDCCLNRGGRFVSGGHRMRHFKTLALMLVLSAIAVPAVFAANVHFIGTPQLTQSGDTLTV